MTDSSSIDNLGVCITGACGLIGQILWNQLPETVRRIGIDKDVRGSGVQIHKGDVTNSGLWDKLLSGSETVNAIIHLAGDPRVDSPWERVLHDGIHGTKVVLDAARRHGIHRVVYASSNHVVGGYERTPYPGSMDVPEVAAHDPVRPDSLYAVGKVAGEALCRYYAESHDVTSVCLRIGSVRARDNPADDPRLRRTWLSHRDLVHLCVCALTAPITFGMYYGVSNNDDRMWDIEQARDEIGYRPVDNASEHWSESSS